MNEILKLIKQIKDTDDAGDEVTIETGREVFCAVASIGQKEFYQAQAVGLQPEIKFVLADYLDYEGESVCEHSGTKYRILRTYRTSQELEIIAYREVNKS